MRKWIIGVDEVGRGPLAGPVSVGAILAPYNVRGVLLKLMGGSVRDSKQMTHEKRLSVSRKINRLRRAGKLNFTVVHVSAVIIDKIGISRAVNRGVTQAIKNCQECQGFPLTPKKLLIFNKNKCQGESLTVRLDGLLKAPAKYRNQKTIIKGDEKDVFIACASIVAKVSRDRLMSRIARKYPAYSLEVHKGYGTALHRALISSNGLSPVHRLCFCKKLLTEQ